MGRQPLGEKAMTDAERQRRRRERLRKGRPQTPAAIIDALRKANAALRREIERLRQDTRGARSRGASDEPRADPQARQWSMPHKAQP